MEEEIAQIPVPILLKDKPISKDDLDEFGYTAIGESIAKLVSGSEAPFTIGLYGQWGIGKSSICNIVTSSFKDNSDYKVFYFDTWKYERDSFRRQFLIEMDEDVFDGRLKYKTKLNQSLTLPYNPPFFEALGKSIGHSVREIFMKLAVPFILLVLSLGALLLVNRFIYPVIGMGLADALQLATETMFGLGVLIYISKFIFESFQVFKGEVEIPKTDSAEGFEYYYKDALDELGAKRLLVVIDNLDRLEHGKAVDLLGDIKTFLASEKVAKHVKNKVIFLIPCDDQALQAQLKHVYKNIDAEEFLRKFFNVSFRIPKIINSELDGYINKKIDETNVDDLANKDILFIIGRAFKNNPREIIQYINSLIALYLVAKARKLTRVVSPDSIGFLAKILVIRIKWPLIYQYLEDKILRTAGKFPEIIDEIRSNTEIFDKEDTARFGGFIDSTMGVVPQSWSYVDEFFSLKLDEFPEWNQFINYAEDGDEKGVKDTLLYIREQGKISTLNRNLQVEYLSKNSGNSQKILNVFVSVLSAVEQTEVISFGGFFKNAIIAISEHDFRNRINSIEFGKFFNNEVYDKTDSALRKFLVSRMVYALGQVSHQPKEEAINYLDTFVLVLQHISDKVWSGFEPFQKATLINSRKVFLRKIDLRILFPLDGVNIDLKKMVLILLNPVSEISNKDPFTTLYQLFLLLQHPPIQQSEELINAFIIFTKDYLTKYRESVRTREDTEEYSIYKQFISQMIAIYNSLQEGEAKKGARDILAISILNPDCPQIEEISRIIGAYISEISHPYSDIISISGLQNLIPNMRIRQSIIQRSKLVPDMVNYEGLNLSEDEKTLILRELSNTNFKGFLEFLELCDFKIPKSFEGNEGFKVEIQSKMISQMLDASLPVLTKILSALQKTKIEPEVVSKIYDSLVIVKAKKGEFSDFIVSYIKNNPSVLGDTYNQGLLEEEVN